MIDRAIDKIKRASDIVVVLVLGVALSLGTGMPYGSNNQVTYLLDPLVHAFPDLYQRDWFVSEMHHYHVAFAHLTTPLYALDPAGPVAFGIAQLVVMVATFAAIYALIATATTRARALVFAGIAGLLVLGGGRALGGTYLVTGYLQPSSLASLAWLIAMVAWMRERRLVAGIALAVGAVFHLNFAVLGIGVFGLAELCARRTSVKQLALLLAPSLVVIAAFLPMMIASSRTDDADFALHVLVKFVFTIHFWPARVRYEVWALMGWIAIAWALRPPASVVLARLRWFALCSLGCCLAAVWLFSIPPLLTLTRLFVWRIAPFGQLAAQVMLVLAACAVARGELPRPRRAPLVALLAGMAAVVYNAFSQPRGVYPEVIAIAMVALVAAALVRRERIVHGACVLACAFALWTTRTELRSPTMFRTLETNVMKWARTTPVDSLFLTPPYDSDFRLMARRAIVVDTKSPPMYLDELVAWYRRLCTEVDASTLVRIGDAWTRWDTLPPERMLAIARTFHANYILLDKTRTATRLAVPVAYEDSAALVYAVP